jgi:hypothetical protein
MILILWIYAYNFLQSEPVSFLNNSPFICYHGRTSGCDTNHSSQSESDIS